LSNCAICYTNLGVYEISLGRTKLYIMNFLDWMLWILGGDDEGI